MRSRSDTTSAVASRRTQSAAHREQRPPETPADRKWVEQASAGIGVPSSRKRGARQPEVTEFLAPLILLLKNFASLVVRCRVGDHIIQHADVIAVNERLLGVNALDNGSQSPGSFEILVGGVEGVQWTLEGHVVLH